ncbi:hypothetical protein SASPL_102646 [Salvia splendens]|uniref:Uncharacterized protein n=1 Tax=Salvia splendens TaxID=180675 RepID=A0A8X8YX32_SALSN|nr:hypothetical protein SASPL_102646 [Salvia splendens]
MSGKELSELVAFVKGTQFDLVEYLQRERYGSARLEDFASGLEMIGQKLHMGTLQNRLDAEFLLANMCSVKFKEWIVVLATLLRRSEVLYDLFRHNLQLWQAYSRTIQVTAVLVHISELEHLIFRYTYCAFTAWNVKAHETFAEYHDLLEELEGRLSLTAYAEDT